MLNNYFFHPRRKRISITSVVSYNIGYEVKKMCPKLSCKVVISLGAGGIVKEIGECIPLDSIDIFWRTLNVSPTTSLQSDNIRCDTETNDFKEHFNKQSEAGKRSFIRKLVDIFNPNNIIQTCPSLEILNSSFTRKYTGWALGFCGGIYDQENVGCGHDNEHSLRGLTSLDQENAGCGHDNEQPLAMDLAGS
ncbi:hypothetical protein CTI12_AA521540 [Artemisia annua]|uniref:Uncharacterized protein n=1 Tax=Artemisia annua TaxID=35608 RepID=A0A2U1L7K1_ARTAN|nr:hypothetical protein CTI12_AA521540 [Artemisia annua]